MSKLLIRRLKVYDINGKRACLTITNINNYHSNCSNNSHDNYNNCGRHFL